MTKSAWAGKLAQSDKGSFKTKKNCWMNSTTIANTKMSENRAKILLQKTDEAEEIDEVSGRATFPYSPTLIMHTAHCLTKQ